MAKCLLALLAIPFAVSLYGADSSQLKESGMKITSPSFGEGEIISVIHTCDGKDISPPLIFSDIPPGAKSLALICDDPDAPVGNWVHWVVFNISLPCQGFPENISKDNTTTIKGSAGVITIRQGKNDFGRFGYGGPCPPRGPAHRYYFKLYALDIGLAFSGKDLETGVTKKLLLEKMKGHIITESSLMGKYQRK